MSKKVLLVFTVLMLATLVLSACGPKATEAPTAGEWGAMTFAPGTEVKIGVSSALAGGYAVYGQDMLNGVELAFSLAIKSTLQLDSSLMINSVVISF